jgi:branched-chain amino acid aminotransferase
VAGEQRARVWVDGHLLDDPDQGIITVRDHGFTVGDGVFEAVKVVDGRPFALSRHLRRLARSARSLGLTPYDEGVVRAAVAEVLDGFTTPLGRLRITQTAGPAPMGSGREGDGAGTLVVAAAPMQPRGKPAAVVTVPWPRNERGALAGVKTTSYAENVVALAYAAERGADEAVFANLAGDLCEGTGSNVFVVVDGVVMTPSLRSGPLAGVTRELAIEWLREEGVEVVEDRLPMTVLDEAEEVWISSSVRDVCAVDRIEVTGPATTLAGVTLPAPSVSPRVLGEGPGPLARLAQDLFARRGAADMDP